MNDFVNVTLHKTMHKFITLTKSFWVRWEDMIHHDSIPCKYLMKHSVYLNVFGFH